MRVNYFNRFIIILQSIKFNTRFSAGWCMQFHRGLICSRTTIHPWVDSAPENNLFPVIIHWARARRVLIWGKPIRLWLSRTIVGRTTNWLLLIRIGLITDKLWPQICCVGVATRSSSTIQAKWLLIRSSLVRRGWASIQIWERSPLYWLNNILEVLLLARIRMISKLFNVTASTYLRWKLFIMISRSIQGSIMMLTVYWLVLIIIRVNWSGSSLHVHVVLP